MDKFKHYEEIAFYRGYRISKDGKLYNPNKKELKGKIRDGYPVIALRDYENKRIDIKFSRLQAYQKYGNKIYEDGIVVRHLNNDKLDTSWDNIAIGTTHDNWMDNPVELRMEYSIKGAKITNKYDAKFVEEIRKKHREGWSYNRIQKEYGLAKSTISFIINHDYLTHKYEATLLL